jgi:beta-phosphoglucomutase-like phosphatase (HAD superfamily)
MASDTATATNDGASSPYMLLFELEGAAIDGRAKLFESAQAVFKNAGLDLNESDFARHCVHSAPEYIIDKVVDELGKGQLGAHASEQIMAGYIDRMRNAKVKIQPMFNAVLETTTQRGLKAIALTVLPEDVAQAVMQNTGLTDRRVELLTFPENERHFPRVDCWLRVPRAANKSARACIAVAGCRDSGKSALSSGMRCLVVPDQFTSYQDFSGVDAVLENADDYSIPELIQALT